MSRSCLFGFRPVRVGAILRDSLIASLFLSSGLAWGQTAPTRAQPVAPAAGQNCPTYPCKATRVKARAWHAHDHINVRFNAGVTARERNGQLSDLGTGDLADPAVQALFKKYAAMGCTWMRVHNGVTEEFLDHLHANAEKNLAHPVPNLNQDFFLYFPEPLDIPGLDAAIDDFNTLGIVEMAEPALAPAPLPTPPDYKPNQHYLYPSFEGGTDAFGVRLFPGGYGEAVRVCDLEYSWNLSHQDLPAVTTLGGAGAVDPFNNNNHGTAVLGELFGRENGFGVTGAVPNAGAYVAPVNFTSGYNLAGAISTTLGTLGDGDVIIIEQQTTGPNYTGVPAGTQFGLVPVEWNVGVYNAIVTAIGNRVHVVMAAGNGSQNLDDAVYTTGNGGHYPFMAGNDSGAIIVGAGASPDGSDAERSRLGFSDYGARLNMQGWGENVYTLGYGSAYGAEGANLLYASGFNGTSSATPIVTGAVAVYNSIMEMYSGFPLIPSFTRSLLTGYGLAQTGGANPSSQHIGPRPDVLATINGTMLNAPVNNNCADAATLTAPGYGWAPGRVVSASLDGAASCVGSTSSVDVWYRFVAPSYPGTLWASTCGTHDFGQLDTGMDTILSAYTACGGAELGCNDDDIANPTGCGYNNGIIRDSALAIPMTPGQQVVLRVANYPGTVRGAFAMNWLYLPANDLCQNAVDVSAGGVYAGTLVNARNDGISTCGSATTNPDIWYRYTACADGTLTVSTCGTHDAPGLDLGVDTVLTLFDTCGGTELACNDDAGFNACLMDGGLLRDSLITHDLTAGQSVLIRVSKYGSSAVGAIRLNVSFVQQNDCFLYGPYEAVSGANPFCNIGANTAYNSGFTQSQCGISDNIYNSIFFHYVAPVAGQVTFSVCDANFDTKLAVYSVCPSGANQAIACNDDTPGCGAVQWLGLGSSASVNATAGQSFVVRVGAYSTFGYGSGTLTINQAGSSGACCAGATCSVTTSGACTGAAVYVGDNTACNAPGNNTSPCCKADYNQTGSVTVQDIFDFLSGYFSNSPAADFNASGTVSVQDIFDFLAGYFAGC